MTGITSKDAPALSAACLGPDGTFSQAAGLTYLQHPDFAGIYPEKNFRCFPCPDLPSVFQAVEEGNCALGIVPLENTLGGTVGQSFDLLLRHDFTILAEFYARISHCLLSRASDKSSVRAVYSHPQALGQAGNWLRRNLPGVKFILADSTAGAAARAAREEDGAAVGHLRLASLYRLRILAQAIEDSPDNWTRFVLVGKSSTRNGRSRTGASPEGYRSSLLFTLDHRPGTLARLLQIPAAAGINLFRLESRPLLWSGINWQYAFFADVEGDMLNPALIPALEDMRSACLNLRLLGAYPQGPYLDELSGEEPAETKAGADAAP
ncbi:MAG: chorismate mutase [Deltaproteobacteria bacterium]|jgi:chorismate mutase/prephenate dehydratase|nr:chorismate mutase [Deltaproteobacteria bacterium]